MPTVSRLALILSASAGLVAFNPRADAVTLVYEALMDGPSEAPPNASPGTGIATITIDTVLNTMRVEATFSGLVGITTAAHIHAPTPNPFTGTASVATQTPSFSGFPLGVTAGAMDTTFDMTLTSSFNGSYITGNGGTPASAFAAFQSHVAAGRAYFNIHSSIFGGGEIRGFLRLVPTPGAGTLAGLGALALVRRRR